jgi:hypothetical protein
MVLGRDESGKLSDVFASWESDGVTYVVLRKYEFLPDHAMGDVDVLVAPDDYGRALSDAKTARISAP